MSILIDENTTFIMWRQHRAMNCAVSDLSPKLRVSTRSTEYPERQ